MKRFVCVLGVALGVCLGYAQPGYVPTEENLRARQEFKDSRFGIFVVWGTYSMMADGEWVMNKGFTQDEYSRLAGGFYPSKFNADEWMEIFKASGAGYITVTARHHDGFALFKSHASQYNVVDATPFKRDVIGELSESCKKYGIRLHIYYSHLDWGRDDYYPLGNTGHASGRKPGDENSWQHYIDFMKAQLRELLSNYGPIGCIWFDGMWDKPLEDRDALEKQWQLYSTYRLIHSIQPNCLIGNNHHLPVFEGEDFQIFEKDLPGENKTGFSAKSTVSERLPLETCETINKTWGYSISDRNFKSTEFLIRYLVRTAGKGANLLLDVGPRPDGTIQEECIERLRGIGKWLEKNGKSIYGTDGGCIPPQSWGVTTQKGNTLYVHVLEKCDKVNIPLIRNKLVSATEFSTGNKINTTQTKAGIELQIPQNPRDTVDQIFVLNFKSEL